GRWEVLPPPGLKSSSVGLTSACREAYSAAGVRTGERTQKLRRGFPVMTPPAPAGGHHVPTKKVLGASLACAEPGQTMTGLSACSAHRAPRRIRRQRPRRG